MSSDRGGIAWLFEDAMRADVFSPEQLTEEHRLIAGTASEFVTKEVVPVTDELERKDWTLVRRLIGRCGDLGLLGIDVPEAFGGVALDKVSSVVVAEAIGPAASFGAAFGAQTNLAIMPILWFGSEEQKRRYLPRLVAGEIIGAYSLSESGSGSDALGARARADRQPDGSWRLNGEKLWITNGGFADVFIVFAKVDGDKFSAFIVERGFAGVSGGKEEHKMGLHGSSTTALILQDAAVPAANLLGEIGKGHKIAFNVLNYGRFKLAANCSGAAKAALREAAQYALSRRQFDRPIATFGAIRQKLAEMAIQEYAVESMLFRTAGLIDAFAGRTELQSSGPAAIEEYAIEASLLKVAGSEMLDFVLDENIQIHGGNGFVRDYPAERRYRDARVNRIFEGTNEINRLLVPSMIAKRMGKAATSAGADDDSPAARLKRASLSVLALASRTYGDTLSEEQEVLMCVADIVREAFAADSVVRRAEAAGNRAPHADIASVVVYDACRRAETQARTALAAMASNERIDLGAASVDTVAVRRRIADAVLARRGYPF
jgi:alkylation response protein AidB-like acyl-CoA dehydrogenase